MSGLTSDWFTFLRSNDTAIAIPLVVIGAGLMLFGWRLWKACVFLSFCLIGAGLGAIIIRSGSQHWYAIATGAAALGALSFCPIRFAVAVLSGLIGGMFSLQILENAGLPVVALWVLVVVVGMAGAGFAFLNRRIALIAITAGLGACLLVSGLTAFVIQWPSTYHTFRALVNDSSFILPFALIVPTAMSTFYQLGEANRSQLEF